MDDTPLTDTRVHPTWSPMLPAVAAAATLTMLTVAAAPVLIRRGLRAPRVVESGTPADHGMPHREVWIDTENGKRLFAWYVPTEARAPAVAVLHGWGANAEMMLPLVAPLHRAGFTLLLVDARCHGRSDDDTFASMPRFAEDLGHALDWLATQPEVDPARLAALGHSVGAGAALLTASRRPELAAVVSLSAFAHPLTMMRRFLAARRVPYVPVGWAVLRYVERAIGHAFADIAPVTTIARVGCPVLLVHGADDLTVPPEDAQVIHAARAGEAVELLLMEGCGHDSVADFDRLGRELVEFLRKSLRADEAG